MGKSLIILTAPCRNDKTFFAAAAIGGAVLLGTLYFVLSAQTQL